MIGVFLIPVQTIIHFKISVNKYTDFINSFNFTIFVCPICGSIVKYHASYRKHFYETQLDIHRIKCQNQYCGKTHAIIPSFSVPGCSIGTKELNLFIQARSEGKTVDKAGQCFIDAGMSADYPESIHKKLKRYRSRIETIFTPITTLFGDYSSLIMSLAGERDPARTLNDLCAVRGFNPVLFSRINILTFPKIKTEYVNSLNRTFGIPP